MRRVESCQICGREAQTEAIIAGARVPVCLRDSQYGQVIQAPPAPRSQRFTGGGKPMDEFELVDDYAKQLKTARATKNLALEDVSHAVGIRTNELHAFEEGRVKPTVPEAQKLERYYKIHLVEGGPATPVSDGPKTPFARLTPYAANDFGGGTLADRVTIKPLKK